MSPRDLLALRARLQEYDPALPKCREVVVEERDFSPDYASEEGQAEWQMTFRHPCCRPEGHEGPCRNTRLILGWPGFSALTALLDEIERLRAINTDLRFMVDGLETAAHAERAAVVAWLREEAEASAQTYTLQAGEWANRIDGLATSIERGEHRRGEGA